MKNTTDNQIMRSKELAVVIGTYCLNKIVPTREEWNKEVIRHFGNRHMPRFLHKEGVTQYVRNGDITYVHFVQEGGNVHYQRIARAARKAMDYSVSKNKETRHKYARCAKLIAELQEHGYAIEKPPRRH